MKDIKFRLLKANEIDVRVSTQKLEDTKDKNSRVIAANYVLYKDARVDMNLLDEVVGNMCWQREQEFKDGKLYCSVGIFDEENKQWVWKEDVGVESYSDAEKGQSSDAFKRACFNWGIGRELYTSPFIWIKALENEDLRKVKMYVDSIEYNGNREINSLVIIDDKGNVRYSLNAPITKKQPKTTTSDVINREIAITKLKELGIKLEQVADYLGKAPNDVTLQEINTIIEKKMKKNAKGNA